MYDGEKVHTTKIGSAFCEAVRMTFLIQGHKRCFARRKAVFRHMAFSKGRCMGAESLLRLVLERLLLLRDGETKAARRTVHSLKEAFVA